MTPRDQEVFAFYAEFMLRKNRCPTMREAGEELGITRGTVHGRLKRLIKVGLIENVDPGGVASYGLTRRGVKHRNRTMDRVRLAKTIWDRMTLDEQETFREMICDAG